ncbi:uncharacterized protein E0L32_011764 [Thyridium curvatum]|uniref:BZIP domain-containing protein n=1 Tax=Thyridium curvatum TaxID=1093900 RepID=A0A507B5B7_9PEZI|nr:uncharacterized protein E0L32_011764 [Thyridium curvatum]TPX18315.1 hypothetical protein E0L32_011764 [Thyridium curvatum]
MDTRQAMNGTDRNLSAADIEAQRRQRKRTQNRINQRAHRQRAQAERGETSKKRSRQQQPFQVNRWRLEDEEYEADRDARAAASDRNKVMVRRGDKVTWETNPNCTEAPGAFRFFADDGTPLSVTPQQVVQIGMRGGVPANGDHLLNLMNYNVTRGFSQNKKTVRSMARYAIPEGPAGLGGVMPTDIVFPGFATVSDPAPQLPETLRPTLKQQKVIHSTWIDLIPFPRMRDNLIKWEAHFDHFDFAMDITGMYSSWRAMPISNSAEGRPVAVRQHVLLPYTDDEVTVDRRGLVVWGEPHVLENWEATPGFYKKWWWAVEGCDELLESTNKWRRIRGEEPLRFAPVDEEPPRLAVAEVEELI